MAPCQECIEEPDEAARSVPEPKPESPPAAVTVGGEDGEMGGEAAGEGGGAAARVRYCRFCAIELSSEGFLATHLKGKRHAKLAGTTAANDCWEWRVAVQAGQEMVQARQEAASEEVTVEAMVEATVDVRLEVGDTALAPTAELSPPLAQSKQPFSALNPCAPVFTSLNPCARSFTAGDAQYVN